MNNMGRSFKAVNTPKGCSRSTATNYLDGHSKGDHGDIGDECERSASYTGVHKSEETM